MKDKKRFNGLQALRAVAAFMVLILHSGFYASERLSPGFHFWDRGAEGVEIFFVLSGFVMVYSSMKLLNMKEGWILFAKRRITRIVPIYWIATFIKLCALIAGSSLVIHARLDVIKAIESFLFIPSRNMDGELKPILGVGWTLNFEMFFYLIFCIALWGRKNIYLFTAAIFVPLAFISIFRTNNWPPYSFYFDPIVLDFLYGMLIAKFYLSNIKINSYFSALLLIFGSWALLFAPLHVASFISIGGIASALIVLGTVTLEPHMKWIPKPVMFLGDASYSLYLFHPLIAPLGPVLLKHFNILNPYLSIILSIILATSFASIIHLYIERPLSERAKRLLGDAPGSRKVELASGQQER